MSGGRRQREEGAARAPGRGQEMAYFLRPRSVQPPVEEANAVPDGPHAMAVRTTPAERRLAFLILFLATMGLGMGQPIMFTILPPVSRELGLSEFQTGMIFTVSALLWVFLSPVWGRQSDRWGRKPVMLIGLAAFGISTTLFAFVIWLGLEHMLPLGVVYVLMILSRCIFGLCGPGMPAAGQAYVADRTARHERTSGVSTLAAGFGLGAMIGPGVGATLAILGLLAPYFAVSALAFVGAGLVFFFLPERTPPRARMRHAKLRLTDPRVAPFLLFGLVTGTAQAIPIQTFTFFLMDTLELAAKDVPQFAGVALMGSAMAGLFAQLVVVQRLNLKAGALMRWGTGFAIVGMVLIVLTPLIGMPSFGPIAFGLVLMGLGFGMNRPGYVAAASLSVKPDEQGSAAGIINSSGAAGFVFAPIVGMPLYAYSPVMPFLVALGLLVAAALYVQIEPRFRRIDVEPMESETADPATTPV